MLHFGFFDIRTDVFVLLAAIIFVLIQALLCFKVKKVIVRLIPAILSLAAIIVFAVLAFVFEGWDRLGYLLLAIFAAILLAVCGLGWGIWSITKLIRKKKENGNSDG